MSLVDDPVRVRCDRVVQEQVDVVLRGQERADVAVQHEVGLHRPLDGLLDLGVSGPHNLAQLATDPLLPVRQPVYVRIDSRVSPRHPTDCICARTAACPRTTAAWECMRVTTAWPWPGRAGFTFARTPSPACRAAGSQGSSTPSGCRDARLDRRGRCW